MPIGLFIALFGYLLGSVPTGLIVTKFFSKVDPRKVGSGNIGATNIFRTSGKSLGILTLAGDLLKGAVPVIMAIQWGESHLWIAASGLSPFLGHVFPIFLGFRGGKGVATALGIFLGLAPWITVGLLAVFTVVLLTTRFVSLSSMIAAVSAPIFLWLSSYPPILIDMSFFLAVMIVLRHRENIQRLRSGAEPTFGTF